VHRLLSSVVYIGKITHGDRVYDGEHEPIVPIELFNEVQSLLRSNKHSGGKYAKGRNKNNAMLRGLVRCASCGVSMTHHFTTKRVNGKSSTRYRYYVCANAQKKGWDSCPTASVPAPALEQFVVDQIREVGKESQVFRDVLHAAQEQITDAIDELKSERDTAKQSAQRIADAIRDLAPKAGLIGKGTDQLAELQDDLQDAEQEVTRIGSKIIDLERKLVDDAAIARAIDAFDPMWGSLSPAEQINIVQMLVDRVDYDGENDTVSVAFRSAGLEAEQLEEVTA
jgi:site-specific DNA recombinase